MSFSASAKTYYVSATGNDSDAGTSIKKAWKSIEKVNNASFKAGDQILFEGGRGFEGAIWVRSFIQGSAAQPLIFGSYGASRARIISGSTYGFYAENTGGIELHNLEFIGSGQLTNTNSGVVFHLDLANTHLQHVVLDNLSVQGYRDRGISIGSANGSSGYDQVRVTRCVMSANGEAGLGSYAQVLAAHHDWYIGSCQAFDNTGRADITTTHTGSGIVLSGVDGALIERCEAHHNGALNANANGGPVGIWGWNCNNLVIQYCESHHNQTGTTKDGGGFDLDGGCTNSVLQYNYSHDNDGPGYLVAQYEGAPLSTT
ncbi:right-handed parallel beta-helix repeat-containing protein [Hymenobacter volaticus]|uniref:Right-handed parallel beta-helix repeat-containing protein n=1 Tax=Hymenobacter volaticus TaxID=2932254 RepID=A0ABY4GBL8_9BACT|nr:right-handed parallel beta-helix repeat-containing protein [Hymenobacter volaticus]UOQ68223.1 right-handed parallel beta-helix repeat-containing protein [Hymenobacter volaticus]